MLSRELNGTVSVVVPLHGAEPNRARAWEWIHGRYRALMPDWEIIEARADAVPWRKGVAISQGVMRADGDVLVIADADVVIEPDALVQAIGMLQAGVPWVVPHTNVKRLDERSTELLLAQDPALAVPAGQLARAAYKGFVGGGIIVTTRETWILSGGIPHEFAGWGGEDEALGIILDTLCGPHVRLPFDLWHLWHPPGLRTSATSYKRNTQLLQRYRQAAGDPDRMRRIIIGQEPLMPITAARRQPQSRQERLQRIRDQKIEQRRKLLEQRALRNKGIA